MRNPGKKHGLNRQVIESARPGIFPVFGIARFTDLRDNMDQLRRTGIMQHRIRRANPSSFTQAFRDRKWLMV
jgi:hypothetical protein